MSEHEATILGGGRRIDAALLSALEGADLRWVTLIELLYPSGGGTATLRRTDAGHVVTDTHADPDAAYEPTGEILDVGVAKETAAPRVNSLSIRFDAVSSGMVGALLGGNAIGWSVTVRKAALNDDGQPLGRPIEIFRGALSSYKLDGAGKSPSLTMSVASHWANWRQTSCRRTNPESQRLHFPGDRGFDFAAASVRDIKWGKA